MTVLRNGLLVPERYSNRFSSNPHPLNGLQFYADLWNVEQQGVGTLTNGTGVATPTSLGAGANTVTVTTEGTFTIWLPDRHTGTAASGTATVTGSPVSLSGNSNTITVVGTGTITVTCTDQVVDRSVNAALCTVTGATWGNQGRTFVAASNQYITIPSSATILDFTTQNFGIFAWVYPLTIAANITIFCRGANGADGYRFSGDATGGSRLFLEVNQGATVRYVFATEPSLTLGTWQFVGAVRDGTAGRIYRNGIDITNASQSLVDPTTSSRTAYIGSYDGGGNNWDGIIGEEVIISRAPSSQEIQQIYLSTKWRL